MNKEQIRDDEVISHDLARSISLYYTKLKAREDFQKLIREVAEEYVLDKTIQKEMPCELEELNQSLETGTISSEEGAEAIEALRKKAKVLIEDTYIADGVTMKYKKRTNWHWKKEFDDELEAIGCLHLCKNIAKPQEIRYDIEEFKLPTEPYIRITNKKMENQEEKERRKKKEAEERQRDKEVLQSKTLDELVLLFKDNKSKISLLEKRYESDRKELLASMLEEKVDEAFADEEKSFSFKLLEKATGFDTEQIFFHAIPKRFLFTYAVEDNDKISCKDWYTGDEFEFIGKTNHDGHLLTFKGGLLSVDGVELSYPPLDDIKELKKKDKKEIEQLQLKTAFGFLEVDGLDFLKTCKTSSTKVEKLVDDGQLHPNVLRDFRHIISNEDMSIVFEMIEEDANAVRRSVFHQKNSRRAQRLRRDSENHKRLLAEM